MAYGSLGRRNKNLIMANQSVLGNQGIFYCKKGGKNYDDRKENRICIFIFSDAVFGMCGGLCRHFHGNGIKQGKSVCKGRKLRAASDLEGRD